MAASPASLLWSWYGKHLGFLSRATPNSNYKKAWASANSESGPLARRSHKVLGRWDDAGRRRSGAIKWTEEERGKKVADGETWSTLFGSELIGESLAFYNTGHACLRLASRPGPPTGCLFEGSVPLTYPLLLSWCVPLNQVICTAPHSDYTVHHLTTQQSQQSVKCA